MDQDFVDKINDKGFNSPWKAKAHDHMVNRTKSYMKNLLGLTQFKV
jgi:hypothetical protein